MQYFATSGVAHRQKQGCVIVGVFAGGDPTPAAAAIDKASGGAIGALTRSGDLPAGTGGTAMLRDLAGVSASRVLVVGLGKKKRFDARAFDKAHAAAAKALVGSGATSALSYLAEAHPAPKDLVLTVRRPAQALESALYRFDELKSKPKKRASKLKKFGFAAATRSQLAKIEPAARQGSAIAAGCALTRDLANRPSNICTPTHLANQAKSLEKTYKSVTTSVLGEAQMKRLGMGALLSVTAGSEEPAKLIVLQYQGAPKSNKPIALVGKGITFDTGGISIKPAAAMDEMKYDMGGAASVLGTFLTVARLKLPLNLVGVIPTCENMPSGRATKPGDIVTSMAKHTIEVLNTDAEGRLILCDALTYVQRFKPRAIIDIATLTGACVIALGSHMSGLMSNDDALADALFEAGKTSGDRAWRLPINDDYFKSLKSNFADFANVGGREAGAITAGCFLAQFTKGQTWAHLDIAGTAWTSGADKGATGRPVPLLSQYLLDQC